MVSGRILAVGVFVCVFGITDYFQMDILGFKGKYDGYTEIHLYFHIRKYQYLYDLCGSAVSNLHDPVYTGENQKRMFWYYGNMILTSFALIMGSSDNAYLSLAAIFGLATVMAVSDKDRTSQICDLPGDILYGDPSASTESIKAYAASVLRIDSAFNLIAGTKFLPVLVVLLWVIAVVLIFMNRKPQALMNRTTDDSMNKIAVYIWIGVIAVVCLAVLFVLYDANLGGHADKYGALSSYVVFNDEWGNPAWICVEARDGDLYKEAESSPEDLRIWTGYVCTDHAVLLSGRNAERTYGDLRQCT